MAELTWISDRAIFEKYVFAQVYGHLAGKGYPVMEALKLAREYARAGAELYFPA